MIYMRYIKFLFKKYKEKNKSIVNNSANYYKLLVVLLKFSRKCIKKY